MIAPAGHDCSTSCDVEFSRCRAKYPRAYATRLAGTSNTARRVSPDQRLRTLLASRAASAPGFFAPGYVPRCWSGGKRQGEVLQVFASSIKLVVFLLHDIDHSWYNLNKGVADYGCRCH